jgi:hypothetical protein
LASHLDKFQPGSQCPHCNVDLKHVAARSNDVLKSMLSVNFFWNEHVLKTLQNDVDKQLHASLFSAIEQAMNHLKQHNTMPPNLQACCLQADGKQTPLANSEELVQFFF